MAIQAQMYSENLGFPLGCPQDLLVDNGCGLNDFCFNLQQQQQPQQKQRRLHPNMQFQQLQYMPESNHNRFLRPEDRPMVFSQNMESQIEKQAKEIDLLISIQNERLRLALQEHRKQQITLLLKNYESKAQFLFQQKDEEIAKAVNRTIELEDLLKRMETENQTWQRMAKENEAMIMSLNKSMEQLRKGASAAAADCQSSGNGVGVEDAESCCEIVMNSAPVAAEQTEQPEQPEVRVNRMMTMMCKICCFRSSSVIMLPCRHLCSCNVCEAFIETCPVCNMVKKASIEALL